MEKRKEYDIEILTSLLKENMIKFEKKKRFIHPQTVNNFIFHFSSFKDRKKKDIIYKSLVEYFDALVIMNFDDLTSRTSVVLFDSHISPIISYYSIYLGFTMYIRPLFILIFTIVLATIVIQFQNWGYYRLLFALVIGWFMIYRIQKQNSNKVYGVYY